ncbi:MAG: transposase [Ardenticatenaceae bacterium]|nr:transposase [Ardenticatenaceae bacterium]
MTHKNRYNPQIHHRRSIRLAGYDYTQAGAYFITICTHNRQNLFGEVVAGEMVLNENGRIVAACWLDLARHFPHITLGEWVVMPNHIHGIIVIVVGRGEASATKTVDNPDGLRADASPLQPQPNGTDSGSIGAMVQNFKSVASRKINKQRGTPGTPVWQRNYWEHIIRNEQAYQRIAHYIANNPAQWDADSLWSSP